MKATMEKQKTVAVVIPRDLIKKIRDEGKKRERTFSGQVRFILKEWAEAEGNGKERVNEC